MAFDAFLKIDGIDGESTDDKHKGWIEVMSYSFGASQAAGGGRSTAGGASAGRVDVQDFSVTKYLDKASAKLFQTCCNGKHIPNVALEVCRAAEDKTKYFEVKLNDVLISGYRPGGSSKGGETLPLEEVSFNFGKIEVIYTETDHKTGKKKGDVKSSYDSTTNKTA